MVTWKFTIIERSAYYVTLDTDDPNIAYHEIEKLVMEGDVCLDKPDEYENDEKVEIDAYDLDDPNEWESTVPSA